MRRLHFQPYKKCKISHISSLDTVLYQLYDKKCKIHCLNPRLIINTTKKTTSKAIVKWSHFNTIHCRKWKAIKPIGTQFICTFTVTKENNKAISEVEDLCQILVVGKNLASVSKKWNWRSSIKTKLLKTIEDKGKINAIMTTFFEQFC